MAWLPRSRFHGPILSQTVSPDGLETEEIPTLVFGGRSHLPHATALIIGLRSGHPAARHTWLSMLENEITYGHRRADHAHVVALTADGLKALGLADHQLASFPTAFQSGMTSAGRSQALGDVGPNCPRTWSWGGPDKPCDMILILYAATACQLDDITRTQQATLEAAGCRLIDSIALTALVGGRVTEPFGFRDGVSQPVLRGTPRAGIDRHSGNEIAAGEFVLGYDTTSGHRKVSPLVAGADDPGGRLPTVCHSSREINRDLGRNGTFLVVRQLEQDVDAFEAYLPRAARVLSDEGALPTGLTPEQQQDLVAAKMIGRWRNGSSLIRNPGGPGRSMDNDFMFAREDPLGLACPIGAHIRRANPRDSLASGSADPLAITARHRLMRVGRAYDPPKQGGQRGILFMCLNADIEMQFEVVQQTWLNRKDFQGLRNESDPILGSSPAARRYTIPSSEGPKRLHEVANFVTVKGGGYFFMPSRSSMRYLVELARPRQVEPPTARLPLTPPP